MNETKVSKDIVERLLEERGNLLRNLEDELDKKKGNLKRWEKEVNRLEQCLNSKDTSSISLKGEYERVREQRVDDALLIDRLRQQQSDTLAEINE